MLKTMKNALIAIVAFCGLATGALPARATPMIDLAPAAATVATVQDVAYYGDGYRPYRRHYRPVYRFYRPAYRHHYRHRRHYGYRHAYRHRHYGYRRHHHWRY